MTVIAIHVEEQSIENIERQNRKAIAEALAEVRSQGRTWSCLWELAQLTKLDQASVRSIIDWTAEQGIYVCRDGAWVYFPGLVPLDGSNDDTLEQFFQRRAKVAA